MNKFVNLLVDVTLFIVILVALDIPRERITNCQLPQSLPGKLVVNPLLPDRIRDFDTVWCLPNKLGDYEVIVSEQDINLYGSRLVPKFRQAWVGFANHPLPDTAKGCGWYYFCDASLGLNGLEIRLGDSGAEYLNSFLVFTVGDEVHVKRVTLDGRPIIADVMNPTYFNLSQILTVRLNKYPVEKGDSLRGEFRYKFCIESTDPSFTKYHKKGSEEDWHGYFECVVQ